MKAVYKVSSKDILKDPVQGITRYDQDVLHEAMVTFNLEKIEAKLVKEYKSKVNK